MRRIAVCSLAVAFASFGFGGFGGFGGLGASDAFALESERVDRGVVLLDGAIRDWSNASFLHLERPQDIMSAGESWGGPDDASISFALNHDDRTLYFAFDVVDDYLVRTARRTEGEDRIEFLFASSGPVRRIGIFVGEGQSDRGAVRWLGAGAVAVPGARIAYTRTRRGYTAEVGIPWSALLGGGGPARATMRAAVLLVDCDSATLLRPETVLGTSRVRPGDPMSLDPFQLGDADPGLSAFAAEQGLVGIQPRLDVQADVVGDARAERLCALGPHLVITGPGVGAGSYFFVSLPVAGAGDILEIRGEELTGDAQREIVVRYRQSNASGRREVIEIFQFRGDEMRKVFAHEAQKESGGNRIVNRMRALRRPGGHAGEPAVIEMSVAEAAGWTEASYHEAPATEVGAILLPWAPPAERVLRFHYEPQVGFVRDPPAAAPALPAAATLRPRR